MKTILDSYNDLEFEMKEINNKLLPINKYIDNQNEIQNLLIDYLDNFKSHKEDFNVYIKKLQKEYTSKFT